MIVSGSLRFHRRYMARHIACGLGGRARPRAWAWLLVGLLLSTLAPAISRTLDHGKALTERGWTEVCSARGMSWVGGDGSEPSSHGDLLHHLDSCGYCVLVPDRGAPLPCFEGWGLMAFTPLLCPLWAAHALLSAPLCTPLARGPPASS